MAKKSTMAAAMIFALACTIQAQGQEVKERDYFVTTNNVKKVARVQLTDDSGSSEGQAPGQQKDFISRNFRYISLCDWTPGMRFMVMPSQKDMVVKTFASGNTGNMVSSRSLHKKILVYDGHSNPNGSLHEHIDFHLENNPDETYYFEVPTSSFDDYCYGVTGVPALAYLGDVDTAIDSLVGKKVRVLVREFCQDSETDGGGFTPVDIGNERRGQVMTITKVGVGTRNYPVKIIVKEQGDEGKEFFQYVTISHTNCGLRDEDFDKSDRKLHDFRGSFELLDDRMAVSPELQAYVGKTVYTFFNTEMRNAKEQTVKVARLSPFVVTDIYRLGTSSLVTLTLKGAKTGDTYTKEVAISNTKVTGKEEILNELFVEGDPEQIEGISQKNLPFIQKQQVKRGFTEAEVRLALGEPSEISPARGDIYQWTYQFKDDATRSFRVVKFSKRTKRVTQDMTR